MTLAMETIEKTADGLVYHVMAGETPLRFTIRYEKQEDGHLVNSIIEGSAGEDRPIWLVVDGRLCPFATTGIIMIAVGAALAGDWLQHAFQDDRGLPGRSPAAAKGFGRPILPPGAEHPSKVPSHPATEYPLP